MQTTAVEEAVEVKELTVEEGHALFDSQARRYTNMSGEDFIRAWKAGNFQGAEENPGVAKVAVLLPFANGLFSVNGRE